MNTCRARFCNHKIEADQLMCRKHWGMVPGPTKDRINKFGHAFKTRQGKDNAAAFLQALADGVEAVLERENRQLVTGQ